MENHIEIINKRDRLRNELNSASYEERQTKEYLSKHQDFCKYHKEVVLPLELKIGKPLKRIVYSICGYSERHGYFRNKYETVDLLKDAKIILKELKEKEDWKIPTIILKVTFDRIETLGIYDFDNNKADNLGFSQKQEIVKKSKCGSKLKWSSILSGLGNDDYTY